MGVSGKMLDQSSVHVVVTGSVPVCVANRAIVIRQLLSTSIHRTARNRWKQHQYHVQLGCDIELHWGAVPRPPAKWLEHRLSTSRLPVSHPHMQSLLYPTMYLTIKCDYTRAALSPSSVRRPHDAVVMYTRTFLWTLSEEQSWRSRLSIHPS